MDGTGTEVISRGEPRVARTASAPPLVKKVLRHAGDALTPVPFALLPTFSAVKSQAPSLLPAIDVLMRDVSMVTALTLTSMAVTVKLVTSGRVGAVALSLGLLFFSCYPSLRVAWLGLFGPTWLPYVAAAYLVGTIVLVFGFIVRSPPFSSPLYPATRLTAVLVAIWIGTASWMLYRLEAEVPGGAEFERVTVAGTPAARPDIYHIVVDGFGRPDILASQYGIDLRSFVQALRQRGFEVSERDGSANYTQTYLSLASMLNGAYLQKFVGSGSQEHSRRPVDDLIQRSSVIAEFNRLGYRTTLIGSSYSATDRNAAVQNCLCDYSLVAEFESAIIAATPFAEIGLGGLDYRSHRNKIRKTFDRLQNVDVSERPEFLLAHIMAPHPPFVFGSDGRDVTPRGGFSLSDGTLYTGTAIEYRDGYGAQAAFVASALLTTVDRLIAKTDAAGRRAIVVIHGDHGPRSRFDAADASRTDPNEVFPVLLAIRWPADAATAPAVGSLVNVYRAIFKTYFDPSIELLEDRKFLSSFGRPYDFREVPSPQPSSPQ